MRTKQDKKKRQRLKALDSLLSKKRKEIANAQKKLDDLKLQTDGLLTLHFKSESLNKLQMRFVNDPCTRQYKLDFHVYRSSFRVFDELRNIVDVPGFRLGYRHVIDSLIWSRHWDSVDYLKQCCNEIARELSEGIVDHVLKSIPTPRKQYA